MQLDGLVLKSSTGRSPTSIRTISMLGLGEAGGAIGSGLGRLGLHVKGFDPDASRRPQHVSLYSSPAEAVEGADLIIAVTKARDARSALESVLGRANAPYVDLSTSSLPQVEQRDRMAQSAGLHYLDGAIMAAVPTLDAEVPVVVAGRHGSDITASACAAGLNWSYVGEDIASAITRKLLRSVFVKGIAASVIEALEAAYAAGIEKDIARNIVETITAADSGFVGRLLEGTAIHYERREEEMRAASSLVQDLGIEPVMSQSIARSLRRWTEGPILPVGKNSFPPY